MTVFLAVDHCTTECVGLYAATPIRQVVCDYWDGFRAEAAAGLLLRHDHGSQYLSDDFQAEIAFLGMESSPASCVPQRAVALGADLANRGGVAAGAGGIS